MKKAVNATTFVALALAASVTYNIVQHQRAKGIRPEKQNSEENAVQSVADNADASSANAAASAASSAVSATPNAAVISRRQRVSTSARVFFIVRSVLP